MRFCAASEHLDYEDLCNFGPDRSRHQVATSWRKECGGPCKHASHVANATIAFFSIALLFAILSARGFCCKRRDANALDQINQRRCKLRQTAAAALTILFLAIGLIVPAAGWAKALSTDLGGSCIAGFCRSFWGTHNDRFGKIGEAWGPAGWVAAVFALLFSIWALYLAVQLERQEQRGDSAQVPTNDASYMQLDAWNQQQQRRFQHWQPLPVSLGTTVNGPAAAPHHSQSTVPPQPANPEFI